MRQLVLFFLLFLPAIAEAEINNAFDTTFAITPSDTVIINSSFLPSGASPRSIFIMNRTSSETLLVNFDGTVPLLSYSPFKTNSFWLVGPDSYISKATAPDSTILWVQSNSCLTTIHWEYKD